MGLKKLSILVLVAVFCGCEAQKVAQPQGPIQKKSSKEARAGNTAMPNEPP